MGTGGMGGGKKKKGGGGDLMFKRFAVCSSAKSLFCSQASLDLIERGFQWRKDKKGSEI